MFAESYALDSQADELDAAIRIHVRKVFDKYGQNLSKTASALKVARKLLKRVVNVVDLSTHLPLERVDSSGIC